jgi:hypothetical protein
MLQHVLASSNNGSCLEEQFLQSHRVWDESRSLRVLLGAKVVGKLVTPEKRVDVLGCGLSNGLVRSELRCL